LSESIRLATLSTNKPCCPRAAHELATLLAQQVLFRKVLPGFAGFDPRYLRLRDPVTACDEILVLGGASDVEHDLNVHLRQRTSADVVCGCYRLKVSRVYASTFSTEVIELHALWYWPVLVLVGQAVSQGAPAARIPGYAVSVSISGERPDETWAGFVMGLDLDVPDRFAAVVPVDVAAMLSLDETLGPVIVGDELGGLAAPAVAVASRDSACRCTSSCMHHSLRER
jgi:hypothetical protein